VATVVTIDEKIMVLKAVRAREKPHPTTTQMMISGRKAEVKDGEMTDTEAAKMDMALVVRINREATVAGIACHKVEGMNCPRYVSLAWLTKQSYGGGGGYGADDDDDLSGAARHASQHAGDSGDSNIFSSVLSALGQNKHSIGNQDIDEQGEPFCGISLGNAKRSQVLSNPTNNSLAEVVV
jgi:hypothetical protein